jgi:hypothetical protein
MATMFDDIMGALASSGGLGQMSRQVGVGERDVSSVVAGALPAMVAALNRNTNAAGGATDLLSALDRDHDGSVLDDLAGFLGGGGSADSGAAILGHTLGGRQGRVETALSRSSGVDAASVAKIMAMLAPIVMGYLAKQRRSQHLDAAGLSNMLTSEEMAVRQRAPEATDLFTKMLDADDDGSVMDDVGKLGSSLLNSFLKG